jgi:hypothetical protein
MSEKQAAGGEDLLERVVALAASDGRLDAEGVAALVAAFRERAERLLAERVRPLAERAHAFEMETGYLRADNAALAGELEATRGEKERASEAHDQLLAHHRALVERVIGELETLPRGRGGRARLGALVAALRSELP